MKKDKKYKITWNKKTNSHSSLANANQAQTQPSKKDKRQGSCQSHRAIAVNTTEVPRNNKDKDEDKKNFSHI